MISGIGGQFMSPEAVITHFHLREGDVVADFGAGAGYFAVLLGKVVGQNGKVYACEIQKGLVDKIGTAAHDAHLTNVYPLWCDLEAVNGTKLADGILDVGLMINTLFQVENKSATLTECARTIRKGGKFIVIDWTDSFGGLGPHPNDVITESRTKELVTSFGFLFERSFPAGDHHYGLAFRRQ